MVVCLVACLVVCFDVFGVWALLNRTNDKQSSDLLCLLFVLSCAQVEFHLPGPEQRLSMLKMYFDKYITHAEGAEGGSGSGGLQMPWKKLARTIGTHDIGSNNSGEEDEEVVSNEEAIMNKLTKYAEDLTEGFSGREIEKVAIAWQAAAYGSEVGDLTEEMMDEVIRTYAEQAQAKRNWR